MLCDSIRFTEHVGEYLGLILFATVAMMFLVSTQNLLLIFIALEFLSLSLYLLTGFDKQRRQSAEAALKYFLFGGMSAGFLLFGISLLYGLSDSLDLREVVAVAASGPKLDPLMLDRDRDGRDRLRLQSGRRAIPLLGAGRLPGRSHHQRRIHRLEFQGRKLLRLRPGGHHRPCRRSRFRELARVQPGWVPVLIILSALSMLVGNLAAIAQSSLRRLLAYSAVGHAGYMLLGLIAHTPQSLSALLYYVLTYALASLGAFGVLQARSIAEGVDSLASLAGLSRRSPSLAFLPA